MQDAEEYARMGLIPGGAYRNQRHVKDLLDAGNVDEAYVDLLSDPQTSGGLLFAVPQEEAAGFLDALRNADLGTKVSVVGRVAEDGTTPCIRLIDRADNLRDKADSLLDRADNLLGKVDNLWIRRIRYRRDESETAGSICACGGDEELFRGS